MKHGKRIVRVDPVYPNGDMSQRITHAVIQEGDECKGKSLYSKRIVGQTVKGSILATILEDGVVLNIFGFGHKPQTEHYPGATEGDFAEMVEGWPSDLVDLDAPRQKPYYHATSPLP